MATFTLTEITPTGGTYAFAAWRLTDGTTRLTYMTSAEFTAWASIGDPPGKPAVDAVFMMAGGGLPAFNTPTGRPRAGNFWVKNAAKREVVLFFGDSPNWGYGHTIADDPGSGQTSRLRGFTYGIAGNSLETTLTNSRLNALRAGTLTVTIKGISIVNNVATVPNTYIKKLDAIIDRTISNHRSVTFDASSHASLGGGSDLTFAHVVASQTDRCIVVGHGSRQGTSSAVTYAGSALTSIDSVAPGGDLNGRTWRLIAPSTGSNNIVCSHTGGGGYQGAAAISAYGVDQTTPVEDSVGAGAYGSAPTATFDSATDGLGFTFMAWQNFGGITNTPDAAWTSITAEMPGYFESQGAYKTGAATLTRTDTLSSSEEWVMLGVALKAAAGGGPPANTTNFFQFF